MRILQTAIFAAALAIVAPTTAAQGLRTQAQRGPRTPFALERAGAVRLGSPARMIPYSTGGSVFEAIPAHGAIVFSDAWTDQNSPVGYYEIPTSGTTASFTLLTTSDYAACNAGTLVFDGSIMTADAESDYGTRTVSYYVVDADTYEMTGMGILDSSFHAYSMVQDPVSGNCYGSFLNTRTQTLYFGQINKTNFSVRSIKSYPDGLHFNALGTTPQGELYGITFSGDLYGIDKTSGEASLVASTGIVSKYQSSGAINPRNGKFYYATSCDQGSSMYEIDPATGDVAKVYDMPYNEEILGMHFPSYTSAASPDYPRDVTIVFEGSSLTGKVRFRMPSTLVDGTEATGEATYKVTADSRVAATGTATYGAEVAVPVTVEAPGLHTFNITVSNDAGDSPATTDRCFIGADTPRPVENVSLTYDGARFTLAWSAAQSENGGFLETLTYSVTRSDGTVVADRIVETGFSEPYSAPENGLEVISYSVAANASGLTAAPTASNRITLGHVVPPYTNSLTTENSAAPFTVFNVNNDRNTWEWDKRGFFGCYYDNRHSAADDYLVFPGALLEKGKVYTVSFDAYGFESSRYTEKVALYVGTSCAPEAFTTCLVEPVEIVMNERRRITANFRAPEEGIFYFAIHCCSAPDQFVLYVDNIEISAPLSTAAPAMVTDLKAVPDLNGALKATVSFTAPTADLAGNRLESLTKVEVRAGSRLVAQLAGAPGSSMSCTDNDAQAGENTYDVIPFNESGEGEHALVSAFVGFSKPSMPAEFTVSGGDNDGKVVLTWSPVTTDVNGLVFNPGDVTYTIVKYEYNTQVIIAEKITDCRFEYQATEPDAMQELIQFAVFPINAKGEDGVGLTTDMVPVGAPDPLPFIESFPGAYMSHVFGMSYDGAEWWLSTEQDMNGNVPAQDGDDGFAVLGSNELLTSARLFSGRIDLSKASAAELTFHYYVLAPEDRNTVQVFVNDGTGWTNTGEPFVMGNGDTHKWTKATLDLSAYAGKRIQICLEGSINTYAYIFIDNLTVTDQKTGAVDITTENISGNSIAAIAGGIAVTASPADRVVVTDTLGRILHSSSGSVTLPLPAGIYIVKAGTLTRKLTVRP